MTVKEIAELFRVLALVAPDLKVKMTIPTWCESGPAGDDHEDIANVTLNNEDREACILIHRDR